MFNGQIGSAAAGTNSLTTAQTAATNSISTAQTAATFGDKLLKNITNNLAGSAIDSAINGKPFDEKALGNALTNALITTGLASGAGAIGDARVDGNAATGTTATLNDFTNKIAHAVLGCAGGAATGGGCGAGAIGAVIGEMTAEYAKDAKLSNSQALALAKTLSAASGVLVGGGGDNAAAVNAAATTGANAAENNYLAHAQALKLATLRQKQQAGKLSAEDLTDIKALVTQDKESNAALAQACASPNSAACGIELTKVQTAEASYKGFAETFTTPNGVAQEASEARTLAEQYTNRVNNAGTYNAVAGSTKAVVGGMVGVAELAVTTAKAAAGDKQAQAELADMVKAAGAFLQAPIDTTTQAIKSTLERAYQLEAAGKVDAAQQLRAALVTNGLLVATGAGTLAVKGAQTAGKAATAAGDAVNAAKAASAATRVDARAVERARVDNNVNRDANLTQGFVPAEQVNKAFTDIGYTPPFTEGSMVDIGVSKPGIKYYQVLKEGQANALDAGAPAIGGFATPSPVLSQAEARSGLAITPDMKSDVSRLVPLVTTGKPMVTVDGKIAPQVPANLYPGGGDQVFFDFPLNSNKFEYVKPVAPSSPLPEK